MTDLRHRVVAGIQTGSQGKRSEPSQSSLRQKGMKRLSILLLSFVIACSGTGEVTTTGVSDPSFGTDPDRLFAELNGAGVSADQVDTFATDPLGGTGTLICVGSEEVRLYLFDDEAAAAEVATRIDPADPSNLGNAIVEWVGRPRFWQREPMLVLYLGEDVDTEDLLEELLGPPFAEGAGPGRGVPLVPSACDGG